MFDVRWVQESDWPEIERWLATAPDLVGPWGVVRYPFVLVALKEGRPVGAIGVMWGPWGYGIIDWMIRDPDNPQSRGAGRFLCRVALATLQGFGLKGCAAVVHTSRQRVLRHDLRLPGVTQQPGDYALINLVFEEETHG